MNDLNTGTVTKYEVWGIFHKDRVNYPDKIFLTTSNFDSAFDYKISTLYDKQIVRETIKREYMN